VKKNPVLLLGIEPYCYSVPSEDQTNIILLHKEINLTATYNEIFAIVFISRYVHFRAI